MRQPDAQFAPDGHPEIRTMDWPDAVSVAFDVLAFDEAVRAHGLDFTHAAALRDPAGLPDRYDIRRGEDHTGASGGYIYIDVGNFRGLLTGNSKELRSLTQGVIDASVASLTPPRFYDGGGPVRLQIGDRLRLRDAAILVTARQLVTAHETGDDRTRFPAEQVVALVDTHGRRFTQGVEFELRGGRVAWGPDRPAPASVYSVRYLYRPFWIVERLTHEIRTAQVEDPLTGNRSAVQMPQACMVQREYVYQNQDNDPLAPDPASPRRAPAPGDGGVGPR